MTDTKECTDCKEEKPLKDFYRGRNGCKKCYMDQEVERKRKYPMRFICKYAKGRAKKGGLAFDLTPEYLESIRTDFCPYLGVKMVYGGSDRNDPNAASLDKIIPELGYIRGNVEFISFKANRMKSNASQEELITFARSVLARYNKTNI